jgi:bifunctional non-homologous end joining protein LigD
MTQTTLYYREGSSDKVYQAWIETIAEGCIVRFAYGRCGTTLITGVKTQEPVPLGKATSIYEKLIREKVAKGYTPGEDGAPQASSGSEGKDSGVRCQLLNPIDEVEAQRLLADENWCVQQKFDGRRLMLRKKGSQITGVNRRGLVVSVSETIAQAALETPFDYLIDGEAVGDVLHVFDLLELDSSDLRARPYLHRVAGLIRWINFGETLRFVKTQIGNDDKKKLFNKLVTEKAEGVVFKNLELPFAAGRPASGGGHLKYKFVETASFIVDSLHPKKRSVGLVLINPAGKKVPAGNVTIPASHEIPPIGAIAEIQFLYAFPESGSVYQPVYLGVRNDIERSECVTAQLKYKPSSAEEAA